MLLVRMKNPMSDAYGSRNSKGCQNEIKWLLPSNVQKIMTKVGRTLERVTSMQFHRNPMGEMGWTRACVVFRVFDKKNKHTLLALFFVIEGCGFGKSCSTTQALSACKVCHISRRHRPISYRDLWMSSGDVAEVYPAIVDDPNFSAL